MKYFCNALIIIAFYRQLKISAANTIAKWSLVKNLETKHFYQLAATRYASFFTQIKFTIGCFTEDTMPSKIKLNN